MTDELKAPFPWFGGKSRVADLVWRKFGDVDTYTEPFFGSGAVLLGRPKIGRNEIANDKDGFVANFWRAVATKPEEVAQWADWFPNEADLHARHKWLHEHRQQLPELLMADPLYCDPQIAGWWVWGLAIWLGSEWCGPARLIKGQNGQWRTERCKLQSRNGGEGIFRKSFRETEWADLAIRMARVTVLCGDWRRATTGYFSFSKTIGVFLDPPYSGGVGRDETVYPVEDLDVATEVRKWCIEHENDPGMRIALCGYEGEHEMPGWECIAWKAKGGYANQSENPNGNRKRERIWFNRNCLRSHLL